MMQRFFFLVLLSLLTIQSALSTAKESLADSATLTRQHHFDSQLPAGNYSGITSIGQNRYAVVSDKSSKDGFFVFKIDIDSVSGEVQNVVDDGFYSDSISCRDAEGIAFLPRTSTLLIVGEEDSRIVEYSLSGQITGRTVQLEQAHGNVGYESLTYNDSTATIWTCTEQPFERDRYNTDDGTVGIIRLQSFDLNLMPMAQYAYRLDEPQSNKQHKYYAHGVSELTAMSDGSLLVLEREFHVPSRYVGATVYSKLYKVKPTETYLLDKSDTVDASTRSLPKILLCQWKSKLNLTDRSLANYEGACVVPMSTDEAKIVLLVADSQNRAGGVLHDYFRTVVLR